jgi:hypothetical protein
VFAFRATQAGYPPDRRSRPAQRNPAVIAKSEATKQSILALRGEMDCFASLAMTEF